MSSGNSLKNAENILSQQPSSNQQQQQQQFQSHDIGIRIQKKLLGRMMSNKTMAKTLIDSDSARLMDNLHKLCKLYCRQENLSASKETADKVVKYLMKVNLFEFVDILNNSNTIRFR